IKSATFGINSISVEIELNEIPRRHQFRSQRSRHNESIGGPIVSRTHMPEAIEDSLLGKYSISGDEIFDQGWVGRTRRCRRLLRTQHSTSAGRSHSGQKTSSTKCRVHIQALRSREV